MSSAWKRFILAAVLGAGVVLSQGCSGNENRPRQSEVDPKAVAEATPNFSLTSKEFSEEFERNRKTFQAKYDGKVVELTGIVTGIDRDERKSWLSLEPASGNLSGVACSTADSQPWLKVLPGQVVKLKGKTPDRPTDTELLACVILTSSGPVPPALTAEEFRKEFADDRDAASDKYYGKYLFLSGEVASVTFNKAGAARVVLKTSGPPQVCCVFSSPQKSQSETLKPGDKLKALGQYQDDSVKELSLYSCIRFDWDK